MKIAALGPAGTFSEATLKATFADKDYSILFVSDLDDLFTVVDNKQCDFAWLPWWNSGCGFLTDDHHHEFLKIMTTTNGHYRLYAEAFTPLEFALGVVAGATLTDIKTLHVNPYVTSICKTFFKEHPTIRVIEEHSSSLAASTVAKANDKAIAAAASKHTCERDGLTVLMPNMATTNEKALMQFILFGLNNAVDNSINSQTADVITSFTVTSDDITKALLHSGLDVLYYRQSSQQPANFLVDVQGVHTLDQITTAFGSALGCYLGSYTRSPLHPQQR